MQIRHRNHVLTQEQMEAIKPVVKASFSGEYRTRKAFMEAADAAMEAAGCPVPPTAPENHYAD